MAILHQTDSDMLGRPAATAADPMSIYALKPRFQALLRPAVGRLAAWGVTANRVTVATALMSIGIGVLVAWRAEQHALFGLLPAWMLLRMACNAVDGMLAREFGQRSRLGAFLNEITDVLSDAALYLPFAYLPHFEPLAVGLFIVLAIVAEMTGTVAPLVGASRRYDGPFGKSDRAFFVGLLGLAIALGLAPAPWLFFIFPAACALSVLTITNRVRRALQEVSR